MPCEAEAEAEAEAIVEIVMRVVEPRQQRVLDWPRGDMRLDLVVEGELGEMLPGEAGRAARGTRIGVDAGNRGVTVIGVDIVETKVLAEEQIPVEAVFEGVADATLLLLEVVESGVTRIEPVGRKFWLKNVVLPGSLFSWYSLKKVKVVSADGFQVKAGAM